MPPEPSSVNSASVAGGAALPPAHSSLPEPQSPVAQVNFPVESSVQCVRPQNLPPHEEGTVIVLDSPLCRAKPVVESGAIPALDNNPGHIVCWHLFTIVNVAAEFAPEFQ